MYLEFQDFLINENLNTIDKLKTALFAANNVISALPKETPYKNFKQRLLYFQLPLPSPYAQAIQVISRLKLLYT